MWNPPGLLKAAGAVSILSIVCVLLYAVAEAVTRIGSMEPRGIEAAYIAIIASATIAGKGFLGSLQLDETIKTVVVTAVVLVVFVRLFRSPKMRYYYASISNKPIPPDLALRAVELQGGTWLSPQARESLAWFLDHMETIVMVGFIFAAIYAFMST